jgi:hypothetical protein
MGVKAVKGISRIPRHLVRRSHKKAMELLSSTKES